MQNYIKELKDKGLVPLRLDNNTGLWVTPAKANEKYKKRNLQKVVRSRRMAIKLAGNLQKKVGSYNCTCRHRLSRADRRHPYTKGLGLFGIYYLPIFTDVLAKYEFIQLTAFGLKRFHENTSFLCGLAAN